jgi:spore germination protein GerM
MKPAVHRIVAVLVAVAALAALAGCGIPNDSQPRNVAESERLQLADQKAPAQAASSVGPKVYFLSQAPNGQDRLQPAGRNVSSTPTAVLTELLNGLTKEEQQERRWRTSIPADTKLMSATQESDGTLVIDLNQAFFQATSENQIKAVAQIVFTATGIDGVQRVKILVEGQPQGWLRGDGTAQPVGEPLTQYAYPELNPTSQPEYPPAPSPTTSTSSTSAPPRTPGRV